MFDFPPETISSWSRDVFSVVTILWVAMTRLMGVDVDGQGREVQGVPFTAQGILTP